MDCVKLISLVQERRSLWDPQDSNYHNRVANRALWCEVATSLNSTSHLVKLKWQRLRDTHRREMRKSNLPTSSQTGDSTWRFFNQMSFLEETYTIKATVGYSHNREYLPDILDTHRDSESDVIDMEMDETTDKDLYDKVYHMELLNKSALLRKRILAKELAKDPFDEIIRIEKEKLERLQQLRKDKHDMEDDDYSFLMSLLPYMRAIPKRRKLQARMRLQQIIIEEIENTEYNLHSATFQ